MIYSIPTEDGHLGHDRSALRAEINLGLKRGYGGFKEEKGDVLNFLTDLYKKDGAEGKPFVPFVVKDSIITYAYPTDSGWHGEHEPALVLTSDKSPLYAAGMSDEAWQRLVENYASLLGERFEQFRVYVTYTRVEVKVLQKS